MYIMTAQGWQSLFSHMSPFPVHEYNGARLHAPKYWNSVHPSGAYGALFEDKNGNDLRKHPDWGKRSLTAVNNDVFERTQQELS